MRDSMPRPKRTIVAAAGLAAALVAGAPLTSCLPDGASSPPTRPNVLLISIDTLRADVVGAYGGTEAGTPTIDALARGGVLFERAVAHVPMTLPSHASMLTSLIPPSHGVRDNGTFVLADRHETLTELLHESGYRTGAFVGAFVLDSNFGLDQGFDVYDDDLAGSTENDRPADAVLSAARSWIEGVGDETPWFAFVHLFDPHAPYDAPAPFAGRFDNAYAAEVAYVDDAIGWFLRNLGSVDDTLVVITADHGEGLGEHRERTHGMFGYDSTLHVPLVLHWPRGLPRGVRVPSRVRHIDLAPTIAELVGVTPPAEFSGTSLVSALSGEAEADRTSYFETFTYTFNYGSAPLRGLYEGQYKFVSLPIPELYDLAADPDETENLAAERARTVEQMAERLAELLSREPSSLADEPAEIDAATAERLESLGYISSVNPIANLAEFGPADDPKNWVHLAEMLDDAVAHHRAHRPAEAIQLLRAIIAEKDDVAIAHTRLARILSEEGRSEEAIRVLEDALAAGHQQP